MKDRWLKYVGVVVVVVGFCFAVYHGFLNTRDVALANKACLAEQEARLYVEETNSATTATILNRMLTNIERLNAWQLSQIERQADHEARLRALEEGR